jgi:hypothetical protein
MIRYATNNGNFSNAAIWDGGASIPASGDYVVVVGDIEDGGDVDPDNPDDIPNAFAGKEKEYFRGNNSELLLGKNKVTP